MQALTSRLRSAPARPWPDAPVPVVLVITDLDVGGAERALVALATGLDRRRWEPSVVALGDRGPLSSVLERSGIPTECLGARRHRLVSLILRLSRALRRRRPRIVQSFLFHANIAARLAAPLAGRPWVVGGIRVAEREKGWHRTLERWTARLVTGSVCVSEGVRRFSVEVTGLPPDRLAVIPNGIDPDPYDRASPTKRAELGVPEGAPLTLFVGRLTRQKGVDVLLASFAVVCERLPGAQLVLVGDGPVVGALRALVEADARLRGRVGLLGRREDVPRLLKAANVVVLPSRWEGMPNVVLEAMAAARPVVATDVEGSRDLVVPGETGWLVPSEDPAALAAALFEALSDPEGGRRRGAAGRLRVQERFSQPAVVAAYERLWSGILGLDRDS